MKEEECNSGFKRVLLCVPPITGRFGWPACPHTGVGYLSASLSAAGIEHQVFDMRLGNTFKRLRQVIAAFEPDLVGLTMTTHGHKNYYEIANRLKEGKYKVVLGGPHVSLFRNKVLEGCRADFAVKNEGERTFVDLCSGKELSSIEGLIYRDGGQIIENPDRPFIQDLDSLPFPTYDKFPLNEYLTDEISIISSRGCPYSCTFCAAYTSLGKKFRMRSAENVLDELSFWYKRGCKRFNFNDDNFTLDRDRAYKICDLIDKHGYKDLYLLCGQGVRADRVDRDLLVRMKSVGFQYLAFGVESGNERVLASVKKGEKLETIERAIKDCCDLGYEVVLFFMIGHPEETPRDVADTFSLALKYPVRQATFYNILPMPNTNLYKEVQEKGSFLMDSDFYLNRMQPFDKRPIFETPNFSAAEKRRALKDGDRIRRKIELANFKRSLAGHTELRKTAAYIRFFLRRLIMIDTVIIRIQYHISNPKPYTRLLRKTLNNAARFTGMKVRF